MQINKIMLAGMLLGLSSLPLIANADLTIANNTPYYSSVKIAGNCSGPTFATPPGKAPVYPTAIVAGLCLAKNPCTASIYASQTCDASTYVGEAQINTVSDVVSNVAVTNPHYTVVPSGNKVTITYLG